MRKKGLAILDWLAAGIMAFCIVGCSPTSRPSDTSQLATVALELPGAECLKTENLLEDSQFSNLFGGSWTSVQHGGEPSFQISASRGVLELRRTGSEPWMVIRQTISLDNWNADGVLRLSAEMKGDLQYEPSLHAFEHMAGLWLQAGPSPKNAMLAQHYPNKGVWDWQVVTMQTSVAPGSTTAMAGFIHQTSGILWVRNPKLIWTNCEDV